MSEAPGFATALRGGVPRRARRAARRRRARRAGAGWCPTRDAWSTPAFAAVLVDHRPGRHAHRLPRAAVDGGRRGRARARAASSGTSRRSSAWLAVTTLVVLAAAYFLLGGPVAVRTDLVAGVLPTGQTFSDLATWAVLGWKRWLTLLPPVDARGPVLALPWLAGLLGGAVTLGVARRWASVPLTAVAPLVLLAGIHRARHPRAGRVLVQGVGFAVGARRLARRARPPLAPARAERRGPPGPVRDRRRARRRWPSVAGLLAGPLLPGTERRRPSARWCAPRWCRPLDVVAVPQPAARVPALHRAQHRGALRRGRAQGGRAARRRTRALRHPRRLRRPGLGRGRPQHRRRAVPAGRLAHRPARRRHPGRRHGRRRRRRVRRRTGCPTVGAPTRVEFDGPRADELSSELWLNPDTDTAVVPGRLLGGERYTMSALLPPAPAHRAARGPRRRRAAASSTQDLDLLDARIDAWTSRAEGVVGQAAGRRQPDAHRGHLHRRRHPQQLREGLPPGPRDGPAQPVRQLHQAGRQRRAVRRHPRAGRAAARHPVAGGHGRRARAGRGGPRARRARLGRGAARRRAAGSRCAPRPSCRAATRPRASSS